MKRSSSMKPELVENPQVSEVFCDDFVGYLIHGDVISLTFAVHRPDHANPPALQRVVTARLTLTSGAAIRLKDVLTQWKDSAADRATPNLRTGGKTIQ